MKGQRKIFSMNDGGLIAQVKGTALGEAGTANDVITKIPSVYADNGKYNVYGKGEALIFINGKRLIDYEELGRLSSKDISSIVLDNNPGAGYDATVKAVIHIPLEMSDEPFSIYAFSDTFQSMFFAEMFGLSMTI